MTKQSKIHVGSHVVTLNKASVHLDVSMPTIRPVLQRLGVRILPADRCDMSEIWRRMWLIDDVPQDALTRMMEPLCSIDLLAARMNVTPQTIRRAGNNCDPRWNLPHHYDLGPRIRRYLPMHIEAWARKVEPEPWLVRRCGPRTRIGLRARNPSAASKHTK